MSDGTWSEGLDLLGQGRRAGVLGGSQESEGSGLDASAVAVFQRDPGVVVGAGGRRGGVA